MFDELISCKDAMGIILRETLTKILKDKSIEDITPDKVMELTTSLLAMISIEILTKIYLMTDMHERQCEKYIDIIKQYFATDIEDLYKLQKNNMIKLKIEISRETMETIQ